MGHAHSTNDRCSKIEQRAQTRKQTSNFESCSFVRSAGQTYKMSNTTDAPGAAAGHQKKSQGKDSKSGPSYLPLASHDKDTEDLSDDDVFGDEDSPRYHNFPLPEKAKPSHHSFVRDRINSVESDNFKYLPQWDSDNHSLRHASFPRKRCSKCIMGTLRTSNMQDIIILSSKSSEDSSFWVKFLSNYFREITLQANKKPLNIRCVALEDFIGKSEEEYDKMVRKASGYKLQLVIICQGFLDFISEHVKDCSHLSKLLLDDRTLALLLDVSDAEFNDIHKKILPAYSFWPRHIIGPNIDENFAKEFLEQALAILSRVWKEQCMSTPREKQCFSVTPKKIRQGQNSVFVILTYPLQKEDIIKVSVAKHGELYEMTSVKRRNPYVIKFSVPESLTDVTSMLQVLVEKNGSIIGTKPLKCESKLREMEEILRSINNPIEFMCQTLKFNPIDKHNLDHWFVCGFLKNKPPHFDLITNHKTPLKSTIQVHERSSEEFPTLLHFAARFGLEKLRDHLLDSINAEAACRLRNVDDMTPLRIAERFGHANFAAVLKRYMNETFPEPCITPQVPDLDAEGYMVPKTFYEYYKACPLPKPVEINPMTPNSDCSSSFNVHFSNLSINQYEDISDSEDPTIQEPVHPIDLVQIPSKYKLNEAIEERVQKELVEIIKNNAPSEADAEKLLEYWRTHSNHFDGYQTNSKKLKPLERIRNMFCKKEASSSRPRSSLSASSPTSSGRSIRYSFGDSGTTSDNEEIRIFFRSQSEDYSRNKQHQTVESNYSIVPTPKPVKVVAMKKDKVARRPRNLSLKEEFYKFPPCGEAVQVKENAGNSVHTSTNSGNHEYINYKVESK